MYPYLAESWIGQSVLIPTYGLFLIAGFTLAYIEALRRTLLLKKDPRHIERLFFIVVVGSLIGARVFHILFEELPYYQAHPGAVLSFWEGGYVFYGGFIFSLALIALYCRWQRLSFLQMGDALTPSLFLGLVFGRIGCFMAGCCWGKTTSAFWAVTYDNPHTLSGIRHVPVHPVQLYEALGALIVLIYLFRFYRRTNLKDGDVFLRGAVLYALLRFVVEFFRGDEYRGLWFQGALSSAQIVSLLILLACASAVLYRGLSSNHRYVPRRLKGG